MPSVPYLVTSFGCYARRNASTRGKTDHGTVEKIGKVCMGCCFSSWCPQQLYPVETPVLWAPHSIFTAAAVQSPKTGVGYTQQSPPDYHLHIRLTGGRPLVGSSCPIRLVPALSSQVTYLLTESIGFSYISFDKWDLHFATSLWHIRHRSNEK